MKVIKRDGRKVSYDWAKIYEAMQKAFVAVKISIEQSELLLMVRAVEELIKQEGELPSEISIEAVQDKVETVLMRRGHIEVAKAYILYRNHRAELREVHPSNEAIADYVHASKYARYMPENKRRETFYETVMRVEEMHVRKFPSLQHEIELAFDLVHDKVVLPSMRSMQFAGPAIIDENARMYNCCFTLIDRPRVFSEILYLLLCGCGVGFSVQKHHVKQLPKLNKINKYLVCHHTISDSISGWANAVNTLIQGHINGYHVQFDYSNIRPAGSILTLSGGKAPGHLGLMESLENMRSILIHASNRTLRPIECHDIICHLSNAVLSGGIRRSSLISLFSKDDEEMLHCKEGPYPSHRSLCNNSVVLPGNTPLEEFKTLMDLNRTNFGDPGFVFIDHPDLGVNPCGEILLNPKESSATGFAFCNLVEVNTVKAKDLHRAVRMATFIATLQATYTDFKYLTPISKHIAERDALIGVSLTGICDSEHVFPPELLKTLAEECIAWNTEYATMLGINPAIRCTCIKPSGTASLELGGVSSGIHQNHSKRYFRRITANPLEYLAQVFREINPHMVEVKPNGDWCITFPMEGKYSPETAIQFLDRVDHFYKYWILPGSKNNHHNISCTVTVQPEEWDAVFKRVWERKYIGMTFLPAQSDKDIPYCPREAVISHADIAKFLELIRDYKPINYELLSEVDGSGIVTPSACDGELCEVSSYVPHGTGEQVFEGAMEKDQFTWHGHTFRVLKREEMYFIARRIG